MEIKQLFFLIMAVQVNISLSSKSDMAAEIEKAYIDRGLVSERIAQSGDTKFQYLVAGDDDAKATILFCHGAAFSMNTWKILGVLDTAATHGFRAIALNLPGYGKSSKGVERKDHLRSFADAIGISHQVVVVAASMGGVYALPFVYNPGQYHVAGLVTVAASLSALPRQYVIPTPTLAIYGELDSRLRSDESLFGPNSMSFPSSELVVFDRAPHPCYLRDVEAAKLFTDLVITFVARAASTSEMKNLISLEASWD